MFDHHVYAVILAGGSGSRFWPYSRLKRPKQLCPISDPEKTMIEVTTERLKGLVPLERQMVVTHQCQAEKTKELLDPSCPRILAEPEGRNTTAALALAAKEISRVCTDPDQAVMVSLHADHIIKNEEAFHEALAEAIKLAEEDKVVCIGVTPTHPHTGYGYIERGPAIDCASGHRYEVKSFREKPELSLAEAFVEQGFLWNSGIFVWKTSTLLEEISSSVPRIPELLDELYAEPGTCFADIPKARLQTLYEQMPRIAIDHSVLEVSTRVAVVESDLGWLDVGSWDAVDYAYTADQKGNRTQGENLSLDCRNTTLFSEGPLIAAIGLEDLVVAACDDAVLVCKKDRAQEVKTLVEQLKARGKKDLL